MAFTFNHLPLPLQLHLSSFSHYKYSFSLTTFSFHLPYCSPSTVPDILKLNTRVSANSLAKLSGDVAEDNKLKNGPNAAFLSGFSSMTDISKRVGRKTLERNHLDESVERRVVLKDRYAKTGGLDSDKRRKEASFTRFKKGTNLVGNRDRNGSSLRVNEGVEVKEKGKRSKKPKVDPPSAMLRVGLDMCSKRGDVVNAVKLYELGKKEGIRMGQYHYAVLLYLCSSAATGVVQPAKSGSGVRSLSHGGDSLGDDLVVDEMERIELDMDGVPSEVSGSDFGSGAVDLGNGCMDNCSQSVDSLVESLKKKKNAGYSHSNDDGIGIQVSKDMKRAALQKGFGIYNEMRMEKVPMNEATFTSVARMAMALGDGDMAFDIVNQMKEYGVNPRLRSYSPALAIYCNNGDVESAFKVEEHMLENGVFPEEPELEALLKVSIEAGKSDKVYYVLHKLRTSVRQVSPTTADLIERWFRSKVASRVGKRKWDQELIIQAMENGGGGWHGKGWLGNGKWSVNRTSVGSDGLCGCCGEKLVTIDLDPAETEAFAESVASIAAEREKNSSFQKFQKWLDYYGPFEAVVDAANIGLYSQRKFKPSKVNAVVNGIRQMLPSRKWPLIVLHNRRITGEKMDEPFNRSIIEKWKNADALYATPTGSNDDWYWLYAAIKCRCLLVTNDEMRDHLFQLLGNDFFPRWKERHQVRFSFDETGPLFRMPPPCSVVIQESEKGHWHIPIASDSENENERTWLCCSRANSSLTAQDSSDVQEESRRPSHPKKRETRIGAGAEYLAEPMLSEHSKRNHSQEELQELSSNGRTNTLPLELKNHASILPELEAAEKFGRCSIDFQI